MFNKLFKPKRLSERERDSDIKYRLWQREKVILEKDQEIAEDKYYLKQKFWNRKMPFGKVFLILLFTNFTILEIFTAWITISSIQLGYAINTMPDFMPFITLLGAVIGQTITYGIYSAKSKAENTAGGIVFETAMKELEQNQSPQFNDNQDIGVG